MCSPFAIAVLLVSGTCWATDAPPPAKSPRAYAIEAKVCQGDPLGTVEDGDVTVLGSVSGGTVPRSKDWFRLVQSKVVDVDLEGREWIHVVAGYSIRTDCEPAADGQIRLRLTLQNTEVEKDSPQETVERTSYKRHDRVIKDGETIRVRWGKSAPRDTWLELTVHAEK